MYYPKPARFRVARIYRLGDRPALLVTETDNSGFLVVSKYTHLLYVYAPDALTPPLGTPILTVTASESDQRRAETCSHVLGLYFASEFEKLDCSHDYGDLQSFAEQALSVAGERLNIAQPPVVQKNNAAVQVNALTLDDLLLSYRGVGFRIGDYTATVYSSCVSRRLVYYEHVLFVHRTEDLDGKDVPAPTLLTVAAETPLGDANIPPLLVAYADGEIRDFDRSPDWLDPETFSNGALQIAREYLGVDDEPQLLGTYWQQGLRQFWREIESSVIIGVPLLVVAIVYRTIWGVLVDAGIGISDIVFSLFGFALLIAVGYFAIRYADRTRKVSNETSSNET